MEEEKCKIRKRGCSSSSSSSLVRKYRFKRAILMGKRVGSSTPVPSWKMMISRSPTCLLNNDQDLLKFPCSSAGNEAVVSARKLAATLWEINDVASLQLKKNDKKTKSNCSSDPSPSGHHLVSETVNGGGGGGHRRRPSVSEKLQLALADYSYGGVDSINSAVEIDDTCPRKRSGGTRSRLKEVSNGLTTSKELLKVINRIYGLDEKHSSGLSLVTALRVELDRARALVDQLIDEHHSSRGEVSYLMKQFAEDKAAWKSKERERIRKAVESMAGELDTERKMRKQTERLNKKLGEELAETKATLLQTLKELDSQKRAKEILEQVCDELATGVGEDRAEVEELKRESAKAREELEREREMLQLADVLREERVQMKLSEAKYQFEEKTAAVDKLRTELEAIMESKSRRDDDEEAEETPTLDNIELLRNFLRKTLVNSGQKPEKEDDDGEVEDVEGCEEECAESDLHSIELNVEGNGKGFNWSFFPSAGARDDSKRSSSVGAQDDSKRSSVEVFKGRKSLSEKIQWATISLLKDNTNAADWNHANRAEEATQGTENKKLEIASQTEGKPQADEIKRHKSLKTLKDHILSSFKIAPVQGFISPARQMDQSVN